MFDINTCKSRSVEVFVPTSLAKSCLNGWIYPSPRSSSSVPAALTEVIIPSFIAVSVSHMFSVAIIPSGPFY